MLTLTVCSTSPAFVEYVYMYMPHILAGKAYGNAYYGQGTGPIFIDSVMCGSSHTKLLQCPTSPILQVSTNCGHDDDAGISCEGIGSLAALNWV